MSRLFRGLWSRRVPHFLGAYFVAVWAILEFLDWLVNRYLLSSHLVDFALALLLLLLPSVLLVAWFHGSPGRDQLARTELIGVPVNLAMAAVVLVLLFGGKDLGAITTTVTAEDAEGNAIRREVPKSEYRRQIALFYFDNRSDDDALDWLEYGVPIAIQAQLHQDGFLSVWFGHVVFGEEFREAGRPDGLDLPLPLKNEIAEKHHIPYLAAGTIAGQPGQIEVTVELSEVATGRTVGALTVAGTDPFEVADTLGPLVRQSLDLPRTLSQGSRNLPVREVLTESIEAFGSFVEGYEAVAVREDWPGAIPHFERAVELDPTFAYSWLQLYNALLLAGRQQESLEALGAAMEHSYRMPERDRFKVQAEYYYTAQQDIEKALAVARLRAEIYPEELDAHVVFAVYAELHGQFDDALASWERVLELNPAQMAALVRIGRLHEQAGRFEEALEVYARYAEAYPQDAAALVGLAEAYRNIGEHDKAAAQAERALLIQADHLPATLQLAGIEGDRGRFDLALARYERALAAAKTPAQRVDVLDARGALFELRGQMGLAIADRQAELRALASGAPPLVLALQSAKSLDRYARAGRGDLALDSLAVFEAQVPDPWNLALVAAAVRIFDALEDFEALEAQLPRLDEAIATLGIWHFRSAGLYARGRVAESRGDCEAALSLYGDALKLDPTDFDLLVDTGRCQRKLGELAAASATLDHLLALRPADPFALLERARIHEAAGERQQAREAVSAALAAWSEADPTFAPAEEARQLARQLG
jgi:tetratricopeptide (TPR) repeat protein